MLHRIDESTSTTFVTVLVLAASLWGGWHAGKALGGGERSGSQQGAFRSSASGPLELEVLKKGTIQSPGLSHQVERDRSSAPVLKHQDRPSPSLVPRTEAQAESETLGRATGVPGEVLEAMSFGERLRTLEQGEAANTLSPSNLVEYASLVQAKDPDKARQVAEKALHMDPQYRGALELWLVPYERQALAGQGVDEALAFLDKFPVSAEPNPLLIEARARLLGKSGDHAMAAEAYEQILALKTEYSNEISFLLERERSLIE